MVGGTVAAARRKLDGAFEHADLHGRAVAYRELLGDGPAVLMIHGIGSSGEVWNAAASRLADSGLHVVIVDLPGHGESAKEPGDYSLGAMASVLRDLLDHLGIDQTVIVGHSLGGGIALQFLYQFPHRVQGLVLVSSGGLGPETMPWLRRMAMPGSGFVLSAISAPKSLKAAAWAGRRLKQVRVRPEFLEAESLEKLSEFSDRDTRGAFLATLRSVVNHKGQTVSAVSKLPVADHLPVLLIWGADDQTIPVRHGEEAASSLKNGKLVVFEGVAHEPHVSEPERFADLLIDYCEAL